MATDEFEYKESPKFETKHFPTFIKEVDADQGVVTHLVAITGNLDDVDDIIEQGAFVKSIAERGLRVKVLDQHGHDSVLRVVGKPLSMREIGRDELPPEVLVAAPEATGGLLATTQYAITTTRGKEVFELVKGGFLPECSIGYDALQVAYTKRLVNGQDKTVRLLKEIRLWEYSNVLWGANSATATLSVKGSDTAPAPVIDLLAERKEALVATLRAALAEAEAFVAAQAVPRTEDTAPAEAGRDEHATEEGAEPVAVPLTPEQEAQRQALLIEIAQLTEG